MMPLSILQLILRSFTMIKDRGMQIFTHLKLSILILVFLSWQEMIQPSSHFIYSLSGYSLWMEENYLKKRNSIQRLAIFPYHIYILNRINSTHCFFTIEHLKEFLVWKKELNNHDWHEILGMFGDVYLYSCYNFLS